MAALGSKGDNNSVDLGRLRRHVVRERRPGAVQV
jgi:hypothetical protein